MRSLSFKETANGLRSGSLGSNSGASHSYCSLRGRVSRTFENIRKILLSKSNDRPSGGSESSGVWMRKDRVVRSRRRRGSEMTLNMRIRASRIGCAAVFLLAARANRAPSAQAASTKFEVSFPASARAGAITGRVFVVVSQKDTPEPRLEAGSWGDSGSLFGADVTALAPDESAVIDRSTPGSPLRSLGEIPAGD